MELESLLGISIEEIPIVFGPEDERFTESFSEDERIIMLGWIKHVGNSNGLARFSEFNFNYKPRNASNLISINERSRKMGVQTPSLSEFLEKISTYGYSDIEKIRSTFPSKNIDLGERTVIPGQLIDRSHVDQYKDASHDPELKALMSQLLKKPIDKHVLLPVAISVILGGNLLRPNGIDQIGNTCTIRLTLLKDTVGDATSPQILSSKKRIRGLAYLLSRPGKLETLLRYWNGDKKMNFDAVVLEVNTCEVQMWSGRLIKINTPVFKDVYISPTADLQEFDSEKYK